MNIYINFFSSNVEIKFLCLFSLFYPKVNFRCDIVSLQVILLPKLINLTYLISFSNDITCNKSIKN